jgi:hypothetical protein
VGSAADGETDGIVGVLTGEFVAVCVSILTLVVVFLAAGRMSAETRVADIAINNPMDKFLMGLLVFYV